MLKNRGLSNTIINSRWSIEIYYDRLKNGISFKEFNIDDYALMQGLVLIMLLAG